MLPINRPRVEVKNYSQDGAMNLNNVKGTLNYQPNSFDGTPNRDSGELGDKADYKLSQSVLSGTTQQEMIKKSLFFKQVGDTYRAFSEQQRVNLIANLQGDLGGVKNEKVRLQMTAYFYCADPEYGTRVSEVVKVSLDKAKKICEGYKNE